LLAQQVLEERQTSGTHAAGWRLVSSKQPNWTTQRGWYLDLPADLERQITAPVLDSGRIVFTTWIPTTARCAGGGTSWLMELDTASGGTLNQTPFDVNGDGFFTTDDFLVPASDGPAQAVGGALQQGLAATPTILQGQTQNRKILNTSSGALADIAESLGSGSNRRLSWRDLSQMQNRP
jgi:type IV pilus assembly protein PilY1